MHLQLVCKLLHYAIAIITMNKEYKLLSLWKNIWQWYCFTDWILVLFMFGLKKSYNSHSRCPNCFASQGNAISTCITKVLPTIQYTYKNNSKCHEAGAFSTVLLNKTCRNSFLLSKKQISERSVLGFSTWNKLFPLLHTHLKAI